MSAPDEPMYGFRVHLFVHVGGPEAEWQEVADALRRGVGRLRFEVDAKSYVVDQCSIDTAEEEEL